MSDPAVAVLGPRLDPPLRLSRERAGLLFAALCAVNGAVVPAVAKLLSLSLEPFLLATVTTTCGALCAAAVLAYRRELGVLVRRDVALRLAAIGALGTAAAYVFFFLGARRTSAIETVLVLQVEPVFAQLLSWLALGHRPTRRRAGAIVTLLLGIVLAVGWEASGPRDLTGPLFLLLPPLCWQLSHLITLRGLADISPRVLTAARYIYGAVFLVIAFAALRGGEPLPLDAIADVLPLLTFQGVVLYYIGTLLWYHAVTRLDLTRATAIVVPSIPILSLAASFLILGETPSPAQIVGLVLAATGVSLFVTAPQATADERIPTATAPIATPPESDDGFSGPTGRIR